MKQNKYDDAVFFEKYSKMTRSTKGLTGAGEWKTLEAMLPDFHGKRVLDLGCGYGWHCQYAIEQGAASVTGVDISAKMLAVAAQKTDPVIQYLHMAIEDIGFAPGAFDAVLSSLAFHYLPSFEDVVSKVSGCLSQGGDFVFSVEHPMFTAEGSQDWCYNSDGSIRHFPVDRYFSEGRRDTLFLGEPVVKFHRTITTYLSALLRGGFELTGVVEPQPAEHLLQTVEGMRDELRRPMMLIIAARKK